MLPFRPLFQSWTRALWVLLLGLVSTAEAQERPLLLGGAHTPKKRQVRLDPRLPRGEPLLSSWELAQLLQLPAPPHSAAAYPSTGDFNLNKQCSFKRPVCVSGANQEKRRQALEHLEEAWELAIIGLGLPFETFEPIHWHLQEEQPFKVFPLLLPSLHYDRAEAVCRGGALTQETALQCAMEGSLISVAPATKSIFREAAALSVLGSLLPAAHERNQELIRTAGEQPGQSLSSSLGGTIEFLEFLETTTDHSQLLPAGFAYLALGATHTPASSFRWEAEPDLFDILRANLKAETTALPRLMDSFAHFRLENAPSHHLELKSSALPQHIGLREPIQPMGQVYVSVTLDQQVEELAFRTQCEDPVSWVWSLASYDAQDGELRRLPLPFLERSNQASQRIQGLAKATTVRLIGTNLGGIDLAHPYDPDHGPHEPHGCQVFVTALKPAPPEKAEANQGEQP
ncbi:MAG: hypothetical protein MK135_03515 [Polyangiaceae bacterium]|nr:hypothetical protein [Polyangiaceae bacterium]